jgi:ferric-dicitrate binding protein FerR (iron transport regulator)
MAEPKHDDPVERIAELARRAAARTVNETDEIVARRRFLSRLDAELVSPRRHWGSLGWVLPGVAALCAAAAVLLFMHARALTFTVEGAELSGQYVSAPAQTSAALKFSDASSVVVTPGSRLRIEDTSSHGARVLLERGQASVRVVHTSSSAWTFAAGPFEVHVIGTRFDLSWDPAHETCDVALREGSVEVRGPGGSGPVVLHSGQRFRGDAQHRTMQVLELEASAAPSALGPGPDVAAPAASLAMVEPSAQPDASVSAAPSLSLREGGVRLEPRPPTWSQEIARGKFKEIVRAAEARGIQGCLSSCSAADLRALSDAARYTGDSALAERTLMSLRQRFPGSSGSEAAFLLGRLHEKRGALAIALGWYDSYLRETPSGPFAAEALAGKLRAVKAIQGQRAAEPIARLYLARFPKGVHVNAAREILESK